MTEKASMLNGIVTHSKCRPRNVCPGNSSHTTWGTYLMHFVSVACKYDPGQSYTVGLSTDNMGKAFDSARNFFRDPLQTLGDGSSYDSTQDRLRLRIDRIKWDLA